EDLEQHALPLLPHPVHPACRLQGARTGAVGADVEGDGAFDGLDDVAESDVVGGTCELVAAPGSAPGLHESPAHQVADNLFEVVLGDVLMAGYFGSARDAAGTVGHVYHRPQRILDLARYLHQAHRSAPAGICPCGMGKSCFTMIPRRRPEKGRAPPASSQRTSRACRSRS